MPHHEGRLELTWSNKPLRLLHHTGTEGELHGERDRAKDNLLPEFEWDEHNEEKLLLRHDVSALEAEQCFANPHTKRRTGDDLLVLGITDDGRMLLPVYEQKPGGVVRVYSARDMTDRERLTYRQHAE